MVGCSSTQQENLSHSIYAHYFRHSLHKFVISFMHITYSIYLILLDFIALMVFWWYVNYEAHHVSSLLSIPLSEIQISSSH